MISCTAALHRDCIELKLLKPVNQQQLPKNIYTLRVVAAEGIYRIYRGEEVDELVNVTHTHLNPKAGRRGPRRWPAQRRGRGRHGA
jgi:phage-related protein